MTSFLDGEGFLTALSPSNHFISYLKTNNRGTMSSAKICVWGKKISGRVERHFKYLKASETILGATCMRDDTGLGDSRLIVHLSLARADLVILDTDGIRSSSRSIACVDVSIETHYCSSSPTRTRAVSASPNSSKPERRVLLPPSCPGHSVAGERPGFPADVRSVLMCDLIAGPIRVL